MVKQKAMKQILLLITWSEGGATFFEATSQAFYFTTPFGWAVKPFFIEILFLITFCRYMKLNCRESLNLDVTFYGSIVFSKGYYLTSQSVFYLISSIYITPIHILD